MAQLGVNIDHIATLRQARGGIWPDPVAGARICESAGCDSIVAHLREDRRHINDDDIKRLKKAVQTRFNLEMSIAGDIIDIACRVRPDQATLVPEKREELTTEGGLDIAANMRRLKAAIRRLTSSGIEVSLFIDPDKGQIVRVPEVGAKIIEIHTGRYAQANSKSMAQRGLNAIIDAVCYARTLGLRVNAGHGLDYQNVRPIAQIKDIAELNIGYSIITRSIFAGLKEAVKEMLQIIR